MASNRRPGDVKKSFFSFDILFRRRVKFICVNMAVGIVKFRDRDSVLIVNRLPNSVVDKELVVEIIKNGS